MLQRLSHLQLTAAECERMRAACRFNAQLLDYVRPHIKAGITTGAIDQLVHEYTTRHGHTPAPLNYHGFPKSCCTSVNEVICHGIPGDYVLQDGDIVNVDLTSIVDGWYGDQSETFIIGEGSQEARDVTQCSFDALFEGINALKPGGNVADIGHAIVKVAKEYGFGVVEEYVGHGIGKKFHQDPSIPHVPTTAGRRTKLLPGVCFTIEPMINVGEKYTVLDAEDKWTVRTRDGSLSAQFEHTVMMTEDGVEILTLTEHGPQEGHKF